MLESGGHLSHALDWPEQLHETIQATIGVPVAVERLSGMSLSGVWRVRAASGSLVVKSGPSAFEATFYETVAPSLRASGIPIPDLYLSLHEPARHWLVIEDIPQPLPARPVDGWQPDQRIIEILARLHAVTRANPPDLSTAPVRGWTDEMTSSALDCLQPADGATLAPLLARLQDESAPIFSEWCWISGDPNPRNWGLRAGGSPALFDWELFGPGIPATDLAIIVPGLGTPANFADVAAAYINSLDGASHWSVETLARQVAIAKVATIIQLLDGHSTGSANVSNELLAWLADTVPAWVATIAR